MYNEHPAQNYLPRTVYGEVWCYFDWNRRTYITLIARKMRTVNNKRLTSPLLISESNFKCFMLCGVVLWLSTLLCYAYIGNYHSVIPWNMYLLLGVLIARHFDASKTQNDYTVIYILSYLLISLIGMVITVDNAQNFGVFFGFASDDSRYFDSIIALTHGEVLDNIGLFSFIYAANAFIVEAFVPGELILPDLLPFNWMVYSLCVVLVSKISYNLTQKKCPLILLLAASSGNMMLTDSSARLYRDIIALFFLLLSIVMVLNNRKWRALFLILASGLIRGANGASSFMLCSLLLLKQKVRSCFTFYVLAVSVFTFVGVLFVVLPFNIFPYSTSIGKMAQRIDEQGFKSSVSYLDNRNRAFGAISSERIPGSARAMAYEKGGVKGAMVQISLFVLYPIKFNSPYDSVAVHTYKSNILIAEGFYIYRIVQWLYILCWPIVLPYLIIGLVLAFSKHGGLMNPIAVYYVTIVLLTALISGQPRHGCAFIVLHPIFTSLGYHSCRQNYRLAIWHKYLVAATFTLLCAWNILRYFFLKEF